MAEAPTARDATEPGFEAWLLDAYLAAQLAGDRRAALRLIVDQGIGRGIPIERLYLDVVQAAQYRIGELWQLNRISVAEEHLATAISQVAVAELYRAAMCAPPNGKSAVVTCVGGELHELGARITADFFEMAGFEVRYLGANVPADALVAILRDEQPDLLVASITMNLHLERLRELMLECREALGNKLRLAVGGHAFVWAPSLPDELGADIYGRDAPDSVSAARRLFELGAVC